MAAFFKLSSLRTRLHGRSNLVAFLVIILLQRSDMASDVVTSRFPTKPHPGSKWAHISGSLVGF